jgi:hypothetical protein
MREAFRQFIEAKLSGDQDLPREFEIQKEGLYDGVLEFTPEDAEDIFRRSMELCRKDAPSKDTAFYATDLYYAAIHKSDDSFDNWDGNGNRYFGELHGESHTGPINMVCCCEGSSAMEVHDVRRPIASHRWNQCRSSASGLRT